MLVVRAESLSIYGAGETSGPAVVIALLGLLLRAPAAGLRSRWPCKLACCVRLGPPDLSRTGLRIKRWRCPEVGRGRFA